MKKILLLLSSILLSTTSIATTGAAYCKPNEVWSSQLKKCVTNPTSTGNQSSSTASSQAGGGSANVAFNPVLNSGSNASVHTDQTSQQSNSQTSQQSNTQTTGQTVGITTGSQAGGSVSDVSSAGGSASIQAPAGNAQVSDSSRAATLVLPGPAMATQLPGGFCTTGKSLQLSFIGIGYGSSGSSFDATNYEKCIKVAEAMRSKLPHEVAAAQCQDAKLAERAACIKSMMEAMTSAETLVVESQASQPPAQTINISPTINFGQSTQRSGKVKTKSVKSSCARVDPACQIDTCSLQYSNCRAISLQQLIGGAK